MKKALLASVISLMILLLPLQAFALTVDGVLYDQTMRCLIVTGGFGKYPGTNANLVNDGGHTANLLNASGTAIPCYGYWYNSVLGVDRSKAVGAGTYVNGGNVGYVKKSTWQHANINTGTGYQGSISSPYRGISRDIDKDLVTDTFIPNAANLVWSFNIQKNSVYANIIGLDSADLALARIQINGTGLPNATTYGKTGTYSKQSTTEISDTVSFGNYYISAFIPNASKYNISYTVSYKRGDKLTANNNNYTDYYNTGSASFSTPLYYIESGGNLRVIVNASKTNGTVIASLTKLSGVTESMGSKKFDLYTSSGAYAKSATTNTSGYAYFYSMPYRTYSIRSDTPPAGHLYDPVNRTVTLSASSITGSFILKRTTGDLSINYTTEDGNSRGSAVFQITRPDSGSSLYTTNASGSIRLLSLPPGTYKVKQVNADADYEMYAAEISVAVTANATAVVDVYNPLLYDFSVGLTAPSSVMQGTPIQITASCTNKKTNTATGVPVKIECDGVLIYSNNISIPAQSTVTVTAFASSTATGIRSICASINESLAKNEKYLTDNTTTKTTTVLPGTNLTIEFINPGTDYLEGTDVISTFRIANTGMINIVPTSQLSVFLGVSYMKNGLRQSIPVMTKDQVIIPAAGDNLVYFKWRVPNDTQGCVFTLNAIVDPNSKVPERNETDNSISVTRTAADNPLLETPDTRYEEKVPGAFYYTQPAVKPARPSVSWSVWEWVNGWYKKNTYGIQIDAQSAPVITPDTSVPSEEMVDGKWMMGSGYGFNLSWDISLVGVPGTILPGADAVTGVQLARCYFPEYLYAQGIGQARSLERTMVNRFEFCRNPHSKTGSRIHFTPLWFPDREYICQGYVSEIWTPAGVVNGYASSNPIQINGSMYDDWHIER